MYEKSHKSDRFVRLRQDSGQNIPLVSYSTTSTYETNDRTGTEHLPPEKQSKTIRITHREDKKEDRESEDMLALCAPLNTYAYDITLQCIPNFDEHTGLNKE